MNLRSIYSFFSLARLKPSSMFNIQRSIYWFFCGLYTSFIDEIPDRSKMSTATSKIKRYEHQQKKKYMISKKRYAHARIGWLYPPASSSRSPYQWSYTWNCHVPIVVVHRPHLLSVVVTTLCRGRPRASGLRRVAVCSMHLSSLSPRRSVVRRVLPSPRRAAAGRMHVVSAVDPVAWFQYCDLTNGSSKT